MTLISEYSAPDHKFPSLNQVMMEFMEGRRPSDIPKTVSYFNKQIKKRDYMPLEYLLIEYMRLHHVSWKRIGEILNFPFPNKMKEFSDRIRCELVEPSKGELETIWRHGQYGGKND